MEIPASFRSRSNLSKSEQRFRQYFEKPILLCIACFFCLVSAGNVSAEIPISSIGELQKIGNDPSYPLNGHYVLTQDIDASQTVMWNGGAGFIPIGNGSSPFTGVFDGAGYLIIGMVIYRPSEDNIGLFGYVGISGEIRNLGLESPDVRGGNSVGGLVGLNEGTVSSCYVTGSATLTGSGDSTGGLVGVNRGTIRSSYTEGSVTGSGANVGGLVGVNDGLNTNVGVIEFCYSSSAVTGGGFNVGGLTGQNFGTLASSYATGDVFGGDNNVGGLVGENNSETSGKLVTACYATGFVLGAGDCVGGLIGCGDLSYFVSVAASFWDKDTSGVSVSGGGKGLSTDQMKQVRFFRDAGWHGKGWVMVEGEYPRLAWEGLGWPEIPEPGPVELAGSGSQEDPYRVSTAAEFAYLSWHVGVLDSHIRLLSDLDLTGVELYPIGDMNSDGFTGVFDGGGHVIRHVRVGSPGMGYVGVFGWVGWGGEIRDLGVDGVEVTGSHSVGGLVGYNAGTLSSCYATGSVTGSYCVGGLVGSNGNVRNSGGTITSCYASGAVMGYADVGGLVGSNWEGTIASCHATDSVTGTGAWDVGGLVGSNWEGTITSSYATGSVSGTKVDSFSIGGLVGYNSQGAITSCYAMGLVTGTGSVGGLVGSDSQGMLMSCYATGDVTGSGDYSSYLAALVGMSYSGSITFCYAIGTVNGTDYLGGLVGATFSGGTITSCYTTGAVMGADYVGGLVGYNTSTVTSCYATGAVMGTNVVGGLAGENEGGYHRFRLCYRRGIG